jgi:hypothetical protein
MPLDRIVPTLFGRDSDLAALERCLHGETPLVLVVHGLGGIGKTTLLGEFERRVHATGRRVLRLDCHEIEPTESGFLRAIAQGIGSTSGSLAELVGQLGEDGEPFLLLLDHYEVFRLMDSWMRQAFLPAVAERLRLILATREAPSIAWTRDLYVGPHLGSLRLSTLADTSARDMLHHAGIDAMDSERIQKLAGGHPLALRMAQLAFQESTGPGLTDLPIDRVLAELTRFYVAEIDDPRIRAAVEAASTVRRVNETMLGAMLRDENSAVLYRELERLHFVEVRRDGLTIHDAVKPFIAAAFRSRDPAGFARCRRAAWSRMREELRRAPVAQLWSYTADLIYLLENPVIREAFFPTAEPVYSVEPARASDLPAMMEICLAQDSAESAALLEFWWQRCPTAFHVARDGRSQVAGFYCSIDSVAVDPSDLEKDPLTLRWWEDLRSEDQAHPPRALFLRRWLGRESGERPSPVQAACWLDLKRSYLELRPHLRYVYLAVRDLGPYQQVATRLGFVPLDPRPTNVGDAPYHSARLDFGAESVEGWMNRLLAHELGEADVTPGPILDVDARQMVTESGRRDLSPLEFGVLKKLVDGAGNPISRERLLEEVWGIHYDSASNVVDTVVRSLRKKLGEQARQIESVRGFGYRYRGPSA